MSDAMNNLNTAAENFLGCENISVIPILVAAIQEQQILIAQLTARIDALEKA
jgi:hypothetical protein